MLAALTSVARFLWKCFDWGLVFDFCKPLLGARPTVSVKFLKMA